jgi:hypothetical protein
MNNVPNLSGAEWVKSSYSNGGGGDCVEWSPGLAAISTTVPVRDSKNPDGPALTVTPGTWSAFVSAVRHGAL